MTTATPEKLYENPGPSNKAEPPRDRWDRYLLPYPGDENGKQYGFQRVTTLAKVLDDTFNLDLWKQRMVARGLVLRPDLLALAATVTDPDSSDGKKQLNEITKAALEAAGAHNKANLGTALHSYADHLLGGGDGSQIPKQFHADLLAYRNELTRNGITELPYWAERVVFNEHFQVSGKFDRIVRLADGTLAIADLKTRDGDLDLSWPSIATQLATYANSGYIRNYETRAWEPMPNVRKDIAIVIHLPVGRGQCHIYEVNIAAGWWSARIAAQAQAWRKTKQLAAPHLPNFTAKVIEQPTPEQLQQGLQPAPSVPIEATVKDAVDPFAAAPAQVASSLGMVNPTVTHHADGFTLTADPQANGDPGTVAGGPTPGWMPTPQEVANATPTADPFAGIPTHPDPFAQPVANGQASGGHPAWSSAQQANIMLKPDGTPVEPQPDPFAAAKQFQQGVTEQYANDPAAQARAVERAKEQQAAAAAAKARTAAKPPVTGKLDPRTATVEQLQDLPKAELQNLLRGLDPAANVARQRKNLALEIVRLRDAMQGGQRPANPHGEVTAQTDVQGEDIVLSATVSNAPGPVPPDPTPQYGADPFAGGQQEQPAHGAPELNEDYYLSQIQLAHSKADLSTLWQHAKNAGVPWTDALNKAGIARMQALSAT